MNALQKFLTEEEEKEIWLLIPSGLVSGELAIHQNGFESAQTITLSKAVFYSGEIAIDIFEANIRLDQISGWGAGAPIFIDIEV